MRSFVGDEPFEPLALPDAPDDAPEPAYEPPKAVRVGAQVLGDAAALAGPADAALEKQDFAPLIKAVWRMLPQSWRGPGGVATRTVRIAGGMALAAIGLLFFVAGTGQDASAWIPVAILVPGGLALIALGALPGRVGGAINAVRARLSSISSRIAPSAAADAPAAAERPTAPPPTRGLWGRFTAAQARLEAAADDGADAVKRSLIALALRILPARRWGALGVGLFGLTFGATSLLAGDLEFRILGGAMSVAILGVTILMWRGVDDESTEMGPLGLLIVATVLVAFCASGVFNWSKAESLKEKLLALLMIGLPALIGAGIALGLIQQRGAKRLTAELAGDAPEAVPEPAAPTGPPPPMRLDVYLHTELPRVDDAYQAPATADRNVVGQPPRRIAYVCDIDALLISRPQFLSDLRRFGPVALAASPIDLLIRRVARLSGAPSQPARSVDALAARIAAIDEAPLPCGDKRLQGPARLSGGYSLTPVSCGGGLRATAVDQVLAWSDAVLVDARGYGPDKAGLDPQLARTLARKAARDVLVLIDEDTDQVALREAVRAAWAATPADSPNRVLPVAPLRWVLTRGHIRGDDGGRKWGLAIGPRVPPAALDPLGQRATQNPAAQLATDAQFGETYDIDRALAQLFPGLAPGAEVRPAA